MMHFLVWYYFIPMLIVFREVFRDEEVETVRDLIKFSWLFLVPALNIFILFMVTYYAFVDFLKALNIKFDWWTNFLNKRIK